MDSPSLAAVPRLRLLARLLKTIARARDVEGDSEGKLALLTAADGAEKNAEALEREERRS